MSGLVKLESVSREKKDIQLYSIPNAVTFLPLNIQAVSILFPHLVAQDAVDPPFRSEFGYAVAQRDRGAVGQRDVYVRSQISPSPIASAYQQTANTSERH